MLMATRSRDEIISTIQGEHRFRRLVIASALLGSGFFALVLDRGEIFVAGLILAAIELCVLGIIATWLKWDKHLLVLDYAVLAIDIVAITLGLHFLGGAEFPFDWVYAVVLVAISISRGIKVGLFAAAWSVICYGLLLWSEYNGLWPHMALLPVFTKARLYLDQTYLMAKLLSNAAMFVAAASTAAFFSSTLKREVQLRTQELQQTQVQLLHSQKLATLGQMAASLAHSLASPITGIKGSAELLMDDLPVDHPGQRRVNQILHWADHLAELLDRLRNLARPPKEQRAMVNVNQVITDVLDLTGKLLSQRNVVVVRDLDADLPLTMGSARMLEEMFMNLVMNARDAMPEGGSLTVSSTSENGAILVDVSDTGTGMTPEVKRRVFEAFFTTKGEHGSGLGLNICRQIVVDHSGQLTVESELGEGTTFTVRLPVLGEDDV